MLDVDEPAVADVDGDAARCPVERGDRAALGVGDAHEAMVALEDDDVADGEVPSTDGHDLVEVEFAGVGASLAGELVEAFDVDAPFGHQQLAARCVLRSAHHVSIIAARAVAASSNEATRPAATYQSSPALTSPSRTSARATRSSGSC